MKIAIIGAGYVGLTSAAVFAKIGHKVFITDKDGEKISLIAVGKIPFYEKGLEELAKKMVLRGMLNAIESTEKAVKDADAIFICVGTPTKKSGEADLSQVFSAAKEISKYIKNGAVVVNKSTVPVSTAEKVRDLISKNTNAKFYISSCPEFLREGSALSDTLNPSRIVIGANTHYAKKILVKLHERLPGERVLTDLRTAETIKYASNAFLAAKISFMNEIANLCESSGANVSDVALGMGLDPRIGKSFLNAGIGYGGSCFPKDTRALHSVATLHKYDFKLLKAIIEVNQLQKRRFLDKIEIALGNLKTKRIGALGLAFKNNTDDVRESAALEIISMLMKRGAKVSAYDPLASENAKKILPNLTPRKKPEDVFEKADCVLILTEWPEFKDLAWAKLKLKMHRPLIIDGRNLLNPSKMRKIGFKYISVGRP